MVDFETGYKKNGSKSELMKKSANNSLIWMGISLKEESGIALHEKSTTGKLLKRITQKLPDFSHHKTNLVDFAPLNKDGKLRYPTKKEIQDSFPFLLEQIESISPVVIVALGKIVTQSLSQLFQMDIISPKGFDYAPVSGKFLVMSIHHPSYISIYKRKNQMSYRVLTP